jgi:hypothetical protein
MVVAAVVDGALQLLNEHPERNTQRTAEIKMEKMLRLDTVATSQDGYRIGPGKTGVQVSHSNTLDVGRLDDTPPISTKK